MREFHKGAAQWRVLCALVVRLCRMEAALLLCSLFCACVCYYYVAPQRALSQSALLCMRRAVLLLMLQCPLCQIEWAAVITDPPSPPLTPTITHTMYASTAHAFTMLSTRACAQALRRLATKRTGNDSGSSNAHARQQAIERIPAHDQLCL